MLAAMTGITWSQETLKKMGKNDDLEQGKLNCFASPRSFAYTTTCGGIITLYSLTIIHQNTFET